MLSTHSKGKKGKKGALLKNRILSPDASFKVKDSRVNADKERLATRAAPTRAAPETPPEESGDKEDKEEKKEPTEEQNQAI